MHLIWKWDLQLGQKWCREDRWKGALEKRSPHSQSQTQHYGA